MRIVPISIRRMRSSHRQAGAHREIGIRGPVKIQTIDNKDEIHTGDKIAN
jgi:hypothetical protein